MFWISFGVLVLTTFTYLIWGSAEVQPWNDNNNIDNWIKRFRRRYLKRRTERFGKSDKFDEIINNERPPVQSRTGQSNEIVNTDTQPK